MYKISYHSNEAIGHFTELVKDTNNFVGCAALTTELDGAVQKNIACNYAVTNFIGEPTYTSGKTASKCKHGTNPQFKGLCKAKSN